MAVDGIDMLRMGNSSFIHIILLVAMKRVLKLLSGVGGKASNFSSTGARITIF